MSDDWRIFEEKDTLVLIYHGSGGKRVEVQQRHDFGATWDELLEQYLDFLSGIGYIINSEDRDRILGN